jgi:hypothetical protein
VAIAVDGAGSAYLAGFSFSPDLPVTLGSYDPLFGGPLAYSDAFVAKFSGLCDPCTGAGRSYLHSPVLRFDEP